MEHDHDLILEIWARLELNPEQTSVQTNLSLRCVGSDFDCAWWIDVPRGSEGELAITLTSELLAELHLSHDKYIDIPIGEALPGMG